MIVIPLIVIVFFLIILTFVWPPDSPWSPWWRTDKKTAHAICKLASIGKDDIVYELGSGDGEFCLVAGNEYKAKRVVGIEIEHLRIFISKIRWFFSGSNPNISFRRADFKKVELRDADVVYFYLVPTAIERILPKLQKELKKGTRIVSLKYPVQLQVIKRDEKNKLYLYTI